MKKFDFTGLNALTNDAFITDLSVESSEDSLFDLTVKRLADQFIERKDGILSLELFKRGVGLDEITKRCAWVLGKENGDIFYLDGERILQFYPVRSEEVESELTDCRKVRATLLYRIFE